jgi:hypothetical protein
MDSTLTQFLDLLKSAKEPPVITEDEVICGRVRLRVFPDLNADRADMLFLEFPGDLRPDEVAYPMAFKYSLVGSDLQGFLARMKASLHSGRDHSEIFGEWDIQCSERGSGKFLSIQATRVP